MKRLLSFAVVAAVMQMPLVAANENTDEESEKKTEAAVVAAPENTEESVYQSEERLEEGFLTQYLNRAISKQMDKAAPKPDPEKKMKFGRHITDWVTAPKFGGYIIGSYKYSDQDGSKGGDGFNARLVRLYIDGTILRDFKYRLQLEVNGTPHIKDFHLDWMHWKELGIKVGQFKRSFTLENPMNPWDLGFGDYALGVKRLAGMGDYCGEPSVGGRDLGIQIHGDAFPIGKGEKYRLLHYEIGVYNGQGINSKDKNGRKDVIGTLQVQPIKGLFVGFFGWTGNYVGKTADGREVTVDRNRWGLSAKYDYKDWSARAEYMHSRGHKISDHQADGTVTGAGKADAWYATVGIPCTKWLKTWLKYDVYRDGKDWTNMTTMYCVAPNFQIHKNLMLQLEYHYVIDKSAADVHYNEAWAQLYVRF